MHPLFSNFAYRQKERRVKLSFLYPHTLEQGLIINILPDKPPCGCPGAYWRGPDSVLRCEACDSPESLDSFPVARYMYEDGWHRIICDTEMEYSDWCRRMSSTEDYRYQRSKIRKRCRWCHQVGCSQVCMDVMIASQKMGFGKHKEKTIAEVDRRYLKFIVEMKRAPTDILKDIRQYLDFVEKKEITAKMPPNQFEGEGGAKSKNRNSRRAS